MLNEYQDETLECQTETDISKRCNPLGEFNSPQDLTMSIVALIGMYVGCYMVSLIIMKSLSRKYE